MSCSHGAEGLRRGGAGHLRLCGYRGACARLIVSEEPSSLSRREPASGGELCWRPKRCVAGSNCPGLGSKSLFCSVLEIRTLNMRREKCADVCAGCKVQDARRRYPWILRPRLTVGASDEKIRALPLAFSESAFRSCRPFKNGNGAGGSFSFVPVPQYLSALPS